MVLLPVIRQLRDELTPPGGWPRPVRIGAAGGLGDPAAIAAAFALGADYVVTGSVNQVAIESGTSDAARAMLALAGLADVTMAPAADMFELGVEVQVLRRGTLFAPRAKRLYELYREYPSLDALPAETRQKLEREILRASVDEIWRECEVFWSGREPAQLERAARDPNHRMALVFRWYLGNSNRWAREGAPNRRQDYQIWCGPAMGAFNAWAAGTRLLRRRSGRWPTSASTCSTARSADARAAAAHGRRVQCRRGASAFTSPRGVARVTGSPIAVVGLASLLPGSDDLTGFWDSLVEARDCISDVPEQHWLIEDYYDPTPRAGQDLRAPRRLPAAGAVRRARLRAAAASLPSTDIAQLLALMVAQRCWRTPDNGTDAALRSRAHRRDPRRRRDHGARGAHVGPDGPADVARGPAARGHPRADVERACDAIADQFVPWQESTFPGLLGNVVAGRIANRFDLGGTNCVTDAACASSLAALSMAVNELPARPRPTW